ncbi:MAG: regulatory protein RecX [Chloroflexi bacterium]|nr:regulatory protein RecX [Chloroflexota bacterium]
MAGRITALEVQKKNKQRVSVYLDGEFAFGLPLTEALHLHTGQWLEDEEIARLKARDAYHRAMEAATRLLAARPRSTAEVRDRLRRRGFDENTITQVVERLQELGYLDDEAFARFWVENRERFRPRGLHALRYELYQKGIAPEIVDRVLADIDPTASARAALRARVHAWRHLDERTFRKRATQFLARRGFAYDIIQDVVTEIWLERAAEAEPPDEGAIVTE